MKLQFWGATRTVTGSMHLLTVNGHRILLDGGLFQGRRHEAFERNRDMGFDPADLDAVILSHAHIDHSGNLPSLVRAGFRGCIYATSATRDLCAYMLLDSAHIQENDVRYVNRRRARAGKQPFEPLYTGADAIETLKRFHCVDYGLPFSPLPGITIHFRDAGHILGSAVTVLDLDEQGRQSRLVFSGDLGRKGLPLLRHPQTVERATWVIMESTYGNRLHESNGDAKAILREAVAHVARKGGKLLVPAFAVGRTQELVYRLNQLWEAGELPRVPVYVDSPLASNATEVFRLHPECFDEAYLDEMAGDTDGDLLCFAGLRYVRKAEDSKKLNELVGPAVIIAASGMCEGGRILHHLRNHGGDHRSTILFVSHQAQHTLGRRIVEGKNPVSIYGEERRLRAKVCVAEGYSAHADRHGLLDWAARVQADGDVRHLFLVHGEEDSQRALAEHLVAQGAADVQIPERGDEFEL